MKTILIFFIALLSVKFYDSFYKPTDYRDAYCGNYSCIKKHSHLISSTTLTMTTNNYTITISKNQTDSLLNIETQEGLFVAKLVGNDFLNRTNRFSGNFKIDSVFILFSPSAGPNSYKYIGKK